MKNIIQIAGVIDKQEALMLTQAGIEYLGFPLRLPVNAVDHTEEQAGEIIAAIPEPHKAVLITYLDNAKDIRDFCDELNCLIIQLHGEISVEELKLLKSIRPDIVVFKSLVIGLYEHEYLKQTIAELSPYVDAFITDTFDSETGASGATGKVHDWSLSRELVQLSPRPVLLAGGLNADNVREAIVTVRPAGVDVHTGIEGLDGRKDVQLTARFISEARLGFELIK